jgi:hypothetical protein
MAAHTSIRSSLSPISDQRPRYCVILLVSSHLLHFGGYAQKAGRPFRIGSVLEDFGLNFVMKVIV